MTLTRQDFEAQYQRSADDPSSAEMLAIWEAAWQAATERERERAGKELARVREVRNWSAEDMRREIAELRDFHSFFAHRGEALFAHFGMEAVGLYNASGLNKIDIRSTE